jgi:peptidoglycan/xylan/chitin deacetylase (PgdA/CDA1 family)
VDRTSNQMLNIIGNLSLAVANHFKTGGIIANEHTLDRTETRRHVEVLGRWFDFIQLHELPERLRHSRKRPFCLLTFDDGKRSNATEVAPELERLGVPAAFFIVASSIDCKTPLWFDRQRALRKKLGGALAPDLQLNTLKQLPYAVLVSRLERACLQYGVEADLNDDHVGLMTWEQVRGLHQRGFSIGAHGFTHAILTREPKIAAFESIEKSIAKVREMTGAPCSSFAFPNGNYTPELAQHAVRCGAKMVMTTEPIWAGEASALWRLPRLQFFAMDSPGKIKLKIAVAASGLVLNNPDGSGKAYQAINRCGRQSGHTPIATQFANLSSKPDRKPTFE